MRRYWLIIIPVILYLAIWTQMGTNTTVSKDIKGSPSRQMIKNVTPLQQPRKDTVTSKTLSTTPSPQSQYNFSDALVSGRRRKFKALYTIAIPTISRPKGIGYIQTTLNSLIENSNEKQQKVMVIVILLGDSNDTARAEINDKLVNKYHKHFESGLIQTIAAPRDYYPPMDNLKRTYHHGIRHVQWRSKQNFDYAFLMEYCQDMSAYYLQLEDDVITVPNFIGLIAEYMDQVPISWTCLEFCELGFIAKLYHSADLPKLAQFLKLFFNEQPNDVLYLHFNEVMLQFRRFVRRPTIFQHKGVISSLELKSGMLQDILFQGNSEVTTAKPQEPALPVEIRQLGRVAGPEYALWVQRKQAEQKLKVKMKLSPDGVGQ